MMAIIYRYSSCLCNGKGLKIFAAVLMITTHSFVSSKELFIFNTDHCILNDSYKTVLNS
jgi:hypothetical protein